MFKVHCSVDHYHQIPLDDLGLFSVGVRDGVYDHPLRFPSPPMPKADFQEFIDNYGNTRGAYKQGGLAQKGPFQTAKRKLLDALDAQAEMVDGIAKGDPNIITESGNVPTKDGTTGGHIPGQVVVKLERGIDGVIETDCDRLPGAEHYSLILANAPLTEVRIDGQGRLTFGNDLGKVLGIYLTKSRRKTISGLTTGTTYYFYYFASNATGVGPLSEVRSIVCG